MTTIEPQTWIGRTCAGYRLDIELGHGAAGIVFMGEHVETKDTVAVKLYPPGATADRVIQNCQILGGMSHPNLVRIFESGRIDNHVFVIMEYVQYHTLSMGSSSGGTVFTKNLTEYMQEQSGMLPESQVLDFLNQLLDVLDFIHGINDPVLPGLPYGGIHPGNILLEERGDGRLAVRLSYISSAAERSKEGLKDPYLSPEELQDKQLAEASDVYSLGAIVYLLLTGNAPQVNVVAPTDLRNDIPPGWDVIIDKTLAFEPAARYAGYKELRRNIENVAELKAHKKKHEKSRANLVSFLLIAAVLIAAGVIFREPIREFISGILSPGTIPVDRQSTVSVPAQTVNPAYSILKPTVQNVVTAKPVTQVEKPIVETVVNTVEKTTAAVSQVTALVTGKVSVIPETVTPAVVKETSPAIVTSNTGAATGDAAYISYSVEKGDSLWRIAVSHGMTVNELCATNSISTNAVLKAGTTLTVRNKSVEIKPKKIVVKPPIVKIPETVRAAVTNAPAVKTSEYTVQKDDTYFSLSRKIGCTVTELQAMNSNTTLKVDQVIIIPDTQVTNAP